MNLYFVIGEEVKGNISTGGRKILHIAYSHAEAVNKIAFFPTGFDHWISDARIFQVDAKEFDKLGQEVLS